MTDAILPYQIEGAAFLASRYRCGLHDEAGLGKTWQAIRALDDAGLVRGVIIARAMLRHEWMVEHKKRATQQRKLIKGQTHHDFVAWKRGRADVLLLSYEMAMRWAIHFAELGEILDFLILDEAHFLRNRLAGRTKAVLGPTSDGIGGIAQWALHAWSLTGTPMNKGPEDIYTFLRFAGATQMGPYAFAQYYFEQPRDVQLDRARELRELIQSVSLRRTYKSVGAQIPDIFYSPFLIEGDTSKVAQYFEDHPGLDKRILEALEKGNLAFIDAQHIMVIRRLCAEAKAVPFAAYLADALLAEEFDRVVIMGFHIAALEIIHAKLQAAGLKGYLVNGATKEADRITAKTEFQENPDVRYFVGNSGTAGAGINLHAACHLFMFESEWNPGDNEQCIKRIRRIAQKRVQHARFVTLAGSFDEKVNGIVIEKTRRIAQVQDPIDLTLPMAAE